MAIMVDFSELDDHPEPTFQKWVGNKNFLSLSKSIFDQFSKFFFLLKACLNCYHLKKWVRNSAPCARRSAGPDITISGEFLQV